ncbi:MAG TPA: hypothetical protein VEQ59_06295 [Polyangiaceae bacterium]|nr:hypothetical protein [Polyangiaceae bacterium]
MDELRESSLLFSLEGLLETERERVQREAREAQKRREEELKRVAEAAERRRVQAQQEHEARERREALQRERDRLEHERFEALKLATVERARIEAESGLRLVEAEQMRKHDLALLQLREAQRAARYRSRSWLGGGACAVALLAAIGAYFGWLAPAHDRSEQHLQSEIRERAARARATELTLAAEQNKNRALSARAERLEAALAAHRAAAPSASTPAAQLPKGPVLRNDASGSKLRGCKDTGDPLDDCLR